MTHANLDLLAPVESDQQFVSFELAGEKFAVPMGPVQEIIRLPEVARLPLAPHALLGLSNLRGRVLPLMSLRRLLGLPDQDHGDASRALVIHCGQALGFLVDRVCSVVQVEPGQLQPARSLGNLVSLDSLSGLIRRPGDDGQDDLLMVLDFAQLVRHAFASVSTVEIGGSTTQTSDHALAKPSEQAGAMDAELRLVSFTVDAQEYGVPIEEVQEIVQLPERMTTLPQSPPHMRGVITLRQRLLPLVDLRSLFELDTQQHDERQRIVVVTGHGCGPIGLITDSVKEVISVPQALANAVPELLARDGQLAEFDAICRLDEGRRLISVLSTSRLLGLQSVREAAAAAQQWSDTADRNDDASHPENEMTSNESATDTREDLQLVVFRLGAEEFGVPITCVQEIVRVPETLTRVPRTPDFVEGVINLRGAVLPVIDQRHRLGLPPVARHDRQRIMVFAHGGSRTGFIVDSVAEVLRVPASCLAPAPDVSGDQAKLIPQVARLGDGSRLVLLIDPVQLLTWQHHMATQQSDEATQPGLPLAA
ncbi:chemotaxis protein CheW [Ideonella sp. DXS29W]|uniref:Chemotaxis protein CheW n=1 Tax=Ideonella lacteola TaxID=2984193 RepID=A0ABU9BVA4_9BURK